MNLEEFIKQTIVQIASGMEAASGALEESTCCVNPMNSDLTDGHGSTIHVLSESQPATPIEFDVAITTSETTGKTGKAGLQILSMFGVGGEGTKESGYSIYSRVKFVIPVALPVFDKTSPNK